MDEHETKYNQIAEAMGWEAVLRLVREALDAGDEHLNTIPLHVWDAAAWGFDPRKEKPAPCNCGRPCCSGRTPKRVPRPGTGATGPSRACFGRSVGGIRWLRGSVSSSTWRKWRP